MSRILVVRPEAEADIVDAGIWYEARTAGWGVDFLNAVRTCLTDVARDPERFPVVACMHTRRDPADWMERL